MYWADKAAQELKKRNLSFEWVDDMKTPSGRIHVGALRGVIVHDLAYKCLLKIGVKAKYTYVFEDQDPMDSLPVYLPKEYEKYMGMPLYKVPSPEKGYKNYAQYYALDFKKVFNAIGCNPEIIWVTDLYKSGKMNDLIKTVLDKAQDIKKIYEEMYKKQISDPWFPFQVYCSSCGKVSTTEVIGWDGYEVTFKCKIDKVKWTKGCGFEGKTSPFSDEKEIKGKIPWKVEWPAKWKVIGVTVEGGGKDHMSKGGSYDLSSQIAERIFNYKPPFPLPYEFFLVGGAKMSSSKGRGVSASEMLEILPPEILRFLMVRTNKDQAINFDPVGYTIPNLFDQYQKAVQAYKDKTNEDLGRIFELSQVGESIKFPSSIRFSVLTQWVQMPNMEKAIKKEGLEEWAKYARIWVEKYAPEAEKFLVQKELPDEALNLLDLQKEYLKKIALELDKNWDAEDFQKELYEISKSLNLQSVDAFAAIYTALIGKNHGPKAAWLILSLGKEFVKKRFEKIYLKEKLVSSKTDGIKIQKLKKREIFFIDEEIKEKYSSISIGIALIKGVEVKSKSEDLEKEKEEILKSFSDLPTEEIGKFSEILSYRKLYKETGVDWHSRRPSPEALLRRIVLKKGLYTVNTCVDAANLVVLKNRVSIGVFNFDKIEFPTVLRFAKTDEEIHLLGDDKITKYKKGEIAYFDQKGGYNIDFNYRDSQRTKVDNSSKNIYINVDGIFEISPLKVEEVLKEACNYIIKYCGGKIEFLGVSTAS